MNRFREQRIKNGYATQSDLAKVLFVNQTAVSQWERGVTTPSAPILKTLSELYGVSIDYLLGNATEEKNSSTKDEFGALFSQLPPDKQEFVIAAMRGMIKDGE